MRRLGLGLGLWIGLFVEGVSWISVGIVLVKSLLSRNIYYCPVLFIDFGVPGVWPNYQHRLFLFPQKQSARVIEANL